MLSRSSSCSNCGAPLAMDNNHPCLCPKCVKIADDGKQQVTVYYPTGSPLRRK